MPADVAGLSYRSLSMGRFPVVKLKPAAPAKSRQTKAPAKPKSAARLPERTLSGLAEVFRMLSDLSRLKIVLSLAHDGEMHVSALCGLLGQSQPAVSHHLTLLRMTGLVAYRRDGKHNFYRVDSGLLRELLDQFFSDSANGQKHLQFDGFSLAYRNK